MLDSLRAHRIRNVLRRVRRSVCEERGRQLEEEARDAMGEAVDEPENLRALNKIRKRHRLLMWAHRLVEVSHDIQRRRCILVRNRWQLLWRLIQQPDWLKWRQDAMLRRELKTHAGDNAASFMVSPRRSASLHVIPNLQCPEHAPEVAAASAELSLELSEQVASVLRQAGGTELFVRRMLERADGERMLREALQAHL